MAADVQFRFLHSLLLPLKKAKVVTLSSQFWRVTFYPGLNLLPSHFSHQISGLAITQSRRHCVNSHYRALAWFFSSLCLPRVPQNQFSAANARSMCQDQACWAMKNLSPWTGADFFQLVIFWWGIGMRFLSCGGKGKIGKVYDCRQLY